MQMVDSAEVYMKGRTKPLNEFLVRFDELNAHANQLSAERVVARTVELVDELLDALYPEDAGGRPSTGDIAKAAEVVEREALERQRDIVVRSEFEEKAFSEEGRLQ